MRQNNDAVTQQFMACGAGAGAGGSKAGPATRSPFGPLKTGWVKTHASFSSSFFLSFSLSHTSQRRLAAESWRSKTNCSSDLQLIQTGRKKKLASFLIIHLHRADAGAHQCGSKSISRKASPCPRTGAIEYPMGSPHPTSRCVCSGGAAAVARSVEVEGWRLVASP